MPTQPQQQGNQPVEDGPWAKGADSYLEATQVQKGFFRWGVNITNRGGTIRTRPGFSIIPVIGSVNYNGNDGVTTLRSTTFTSATANFVPRDTGKTITASTIPAGTTIVAVVDSQTVTLSQLATGSASNLAFTILLRVGTIIGQPRGITLFTDQNHNTYLVIAVGYYIYFLKYPFFDVWTWIPQLTFEGTGPVCFTRCIISVVEHADGSLTDVDPLPILIIQDGRSRAGYWDGRVARHLDPSKKVPYGGPSETPVGMWGEWSGNRYWVSNGSRLRASNLLNPIKFTEEDLLEEGGFMQFSENITGLTNTYDFRNLLVFTDGTTSTIQSSIIDRTQWAITPGFQALIFFGIGCVSGTAIAAQWGMKWWYSHDGLMSLDEGIRAYQSSKVTYRDREMAWSKGNISQGLHRRIAMGSFENLLMVSVPSGDQYNAHTWVMDEAPLDVLTYWGFFGLPSWYGVWEGIRPVAWITGAVKGMNRTFCISNDYNGENNVWECVTGDRLDNNFDLPSFQFTPKPITCSLETKLLGYDGQYKFFRFAEIYLDNIEGEVDLNVFYAPRRGGYKQVLQKHIVSSDWILQNPDTTFNSDQFIFDPLRPQTRVVRTISEAKTYPINGLPIPPNPPLSDDIFQAVQTSRNAPYPRQKDYGFSLLLQWTGRLSLSSVRMYFDPEEQEMEGIAEVDEGSDRFVNMRGWNVVGSDLTPYVIDVASFDFQSHVITGTAPLWTDFNFATITDPFYRTT
ncbi:MAG: hypothetical protein C5B54_06335 [Acidobacteria bacterium]|nr:MAG: hypothetical protein C5B54_06335 [Acidobacteriota bacterium]